MSVSASFARLPGRAELRSVAALAAPITVMHLGMMLYGVVDTMFMGRIGPAAIAGVGLAHSTYISLFLFGLGCLMGIDTLSSQAFGAGDRRGSARVLVHSAVLSAAVAAPLFLMLGLAGPFYRLVGVDAEVTRTALEYLVYLRWMMFPALLFSACRHYLQSMDITRPLLWGIVLGNVSNVLLDYGLVFGRLGLPEWGVPGCAVASVATTSLMLALAGAAAASQASRDGFRFEGWHPALFKELLRLGMPAGFQLFIEVSSFSLVTTFMGRFGAIPTAAHQITFNLAGLSFMVPLGVSAAAAVRVGQGLGRGDREAAVRSGDAALLLGGGFMCAAAAVFLLVPGFFFSLYTPSAAIAAAGFPLLRICALFQVFDGAQVVLTGALRGLGETRIPLYANFLGHAALGIPFGWWLAFRGGAGPSGLWYGLLLGLGAVAVLLFGVWRGRTGALAKR